jgi:hypothetical protein
MPQSHVKSIRSFFSAGSSKGVIFVRGIELKHSLPIEIKNFHGMQVLLAALFARSEKQISTISAKEFAAKKLEQFLLY